MEKKPTDVLEDEHRYILKVIGAMSVLAETLEKGEQVDPETFMNIVEFMRIFADKCHHGKEEALLFPLLEKRGVPPHGCPIGVLVHDHQTGRTLVTGLAEAAEGFQKGDPTARDALMKNIRGITDLYPGHIWREDYLAFPMSNKVLNADDQKSLSEEFEKVDEIIGRDVYQRLIHLADDLE
ncbi:MAG: hemerythrin domain-containing protein [Anaerolineales bacterium]